MKLKREENILKKVDMNKLLENVKDVSSKAKIGTLKATETVLQHSSKAVDSAGNFADNIGEKVGATVVSIKEDKLNRENSEQEVKEKKINLETMLQNSIDQYNQAFTEMNDYGIRLYVERERAQDLILHIENLINSIANHPKSFDADIEQIQMFRKEFRKVCDFAKGELAVAKKTAVGAGSGVVTGAAVASVAPTAAMWIATTFGTASTGTAISSLSGAAATNATLAWIGGGTLAAGGGGMSAGTAFLALAGPIGWGIAGVTIFTSVALFAKNKMKTNKERNEEIEKVEVNIKSVRESAERISNFLQKTEDLRVKLSDQYAKCLSYYEKSFKDIDEVNQMTLGTLVNNTKSLAVTLSEIL